MATCIAHLRVAEIDASVNNTSAIISDKLSNELPACKISSQPEFSICSIHIDGNSI